MSFRHFSRVATSRMIEYAGKLCLAPMVRSGELPTRLLSLKYGADLVWTPEIIDKKIIKTNRVVNNKLNTIDYIDSSVQIDYSKPKNKYRKPPVILRISPEMESGKLIFQMGTANPDLAVEAGLKVIDDVDGIDLNCGCPKPFSTHAGMGAALLQNQSVLISILENLVEKVGKPKNKPISCKIRLLDPVDPTPTMELLQKVVKTGVKNITIHCRTPSMRNRELPYKKSILPTLIDFIQGHNISVLINGNIRSRHDFESLQKNLNNYTIGGMIAESAETNPSVFSHQPLVWKKMLIEFIETCIKIDNHDSNTKYISLNQIPGKSSYYKKYSQLKNNEDFLQFANTFEDDNQIHLKSCQRDVLLSPQEYETYKWDFDEDELRKIEQQNLAANLEVKEPKKNESKKRGLSGNEPSSKLLKSNDLKTVSV